MIKMYPLEWFDSLIINSFDAGSSSISVSESEQEILNERMVSESKKLKFILKTLFLSSKAKGRSGSL